MLAFMILLLAMLNIILWFLVFFVRDMVVDTQNVVNLQAREIFDLKESMNGIKTDKNR